MNCPAGKASKALHCREVQLAWHSRVFAFYPQGDTSSLACAILLQKLSLRLNGSAHSSQPTLLMPVQFAFWLLCFSLPAVQLFLFPKTPQHSQCLHWPLKPLPLYSFSDPVISVLLLTAHFCPGMLFKIHLITLCLGVVFQCMKISHFSCPPLCPAQWYKDSSPWWMLHVRIWNELSVLFLRLMLLWTPFPRTSNLVKGPFLRPS